MKDAFKWLEALSTEPAAPNLGTAALAERASIACLGAAVIEAVASDRADALHVALGAPLHLTCFVAPAREDEEPQEAPARDDDEEVRFAATSAIARAA